MNSFTTKGSHNNTASGMTQEAREEHPAMPPPPAKVPPPGWPALSGTAQAGPQAAGRFLPSPGGRAVPERVEASPLPGPARFLTEAQEEWW